MNDTANMTSKLPLQIPQGGPQVLRFPAEEPAQIRLRVRMEVEQTAGRSADIEDAPTFRFLVREKTAVAKTTMSEGRGSVTQDPYAFSMLFQGVKTPGTDLVTITLPPFLGMIQDGKAVVQCEAVLEAVVGSLLFEAAKLNLEFFRKPTVTASVIHDPVPAGVVDHSTTTRGRTLSEGQPMPEEVKDILFAVRQAVAASSPDFHQVQPQVAESARKSTLSPPPPSPSPSPLKDKLKEMILKTLMEGSFDSTQSQ